MSGHVFGPGEHPADPILAELRHKLAEHLDAIGKLFNAPKLTLLVRAPDLPDGDVLIGDDDFDQAAAAIRRHAQAIAIKVPKPAAAAAIEPDPWTCKARLSKTDPPQDCDWPMCGCDPHANNVLTALDESGYAIVPAAHSWEGALEVLRPVVPATYGEAVQLYRWLLADVPPHEWDNRTTPENAAWLVRVLTHTSLTPQLIIEEPRAHAFAGVVLVYVNKTPQLAASLRYLPDMMAGRVNPLPTLEEVLDTIEIAVADARKRRAAERGGN